MSNEQGRALGKMLRHAIGLCLAIFELMTGKPAPDWRELLK